MSKIIEAYRDLAGKLGDIKVESPDKRLSLYKGVLEELDKTRVSNVIRGFMEDGLYDKYLRLSYEHQGGFDKFILLRMDGLSDLRMHVWWPKDARKEDEYAVHNHRWDFCSRIIHGALRQNIYSEFDGGVEYYEHDYYIDNDSSTSITKISGKAYLELLMSHEVTEGGVYSLHHSLLHSAFNVYKEPLITLCVTSPQVKDRTLVYTKKPIKTSIHRRGRTNDTYSLHDKLLKVYDIIKGG